MHIQNFDPFDFNKKKIAGVDVYYKNLPWSPCIHIYFTFPVGAFTDPVGKEGVAHFLEHMIFDGSPLSPDKKSINKFNKIYMLNSRNAFTSYYSTYYVGKCLPENFEKVFALFKDSIFNPYLRTEDVEHERKVITQEAWGRYKNEKYLNYIKKTMSSVYYGNQRSRLYSPLGWPETVAKISQKDLKDFHSKHYNKKNLSIVLVGDIKEKDLSIVEKIIKDIPDGKRSLLNEGLINKPKKLKIKVNSDDIGDPQEQVEFTISRATTKKDSKNNWLRMQTRMFLAEILHERLRVEHSLCYGVSVSSNNYEGYYEMAVSLNTSEDKLTLIEKEIWSVFKEIQTPKWKERFAETKNLMIDQIRSNELSSGQIIDTASRDVATKSRIETQKEKLNKIKKVTYKDIQKTIKEIFDPKYTFTEIILPSKKN